MTPGSSTATPTWTRRSSGTSSAPAPLARHDDCRHGPLRFHPRAGESRKACAGRAQPRTRRRHLSRGDGRRHRLDVDHLPRVPRRRRRVAEGHQLRRQHRALRAAHLRHGRARIRPTEHRRRHGGDGESSCATRCTQAPSASRPRAATNTRRPTIVRSRLASRRGTRCAVSSSVLSDLGTGIFQLTSEPAGQSPDPEIRKEYFDRLRNLALSSGVPITFGVSPTAGGRAAIEMIDDVCAQGGRMFGLTHSRGISVITSFQTRLAFDVLPEWKELRALPLDEQKHLLRDDAVGRGSSTPRTTATTVAPSAPRPASPTTTAMRVFDHPLVPFNPTVAEVAAKRGVDPVELIIDLALESNIDQFFVQPLTPGTADDLVPRHAPPSHGDDVLRLGRAREPDRRLLDPDAPARVLGARASRVQHRRSGAHVHPCAVGRVGLSRSRPPARRASRRHQRLRPRHDRARDAHGRARPARRRAPARAKGLRVQGDGRQRRGARRDGAHTGAYPGQLLRGPLATSR